MAVIRFGHPRAHGVGRRSPGWNGGGNPRRPSSGTRPTFPTSRRYGAAGKKSRKRRPRTSPALGEPDLARVVSYVNFQGETWAYPLWQQLLHQVNHATQHRSEAALLLTPARLFAWLARFSLLYR